MRWIIPRQTKKKPKLGVLGIGGNWESLDCTERGRGKGRRGGVDGGRGPEVARLHFPPIFIFHRVFRLN